jgi:hypothetical protein
LKLAASRYVAITPRLSASSTYSTGDEVFFGFYPLVKRSVSVGGKSVIIRDVMGKDSTLFHFPVEDDDHTIATPFVEQSKAWFESIWAIAHEYSP